MEIALPRTEIKSGTGHKGFSVEVDPHLPFEQAAARRDFTFNASADPLTGTVDPFGGFEDLHQRVLRHVGPAFVEDPPGPTGHAIHSQIDLQADPETIRLCQSVTMEELAPERVYEWKKLILQGRNLSAGLNFLKEVGWLSYFPELEALVDCPQDPEWHPEGDVWVHTLHCLDAFARERTGDGWEDLVVGFGVLCHDLGKPLTTHVAEDGRIRSPMHEPKGENPTRSFLSRLSNQVDLHEEVVPLVRRHLTPRIFYQDQAGDGAIRRLARKVKRIDRLVRVASADIAGRPPRQDDFPEGPWLLKRAEELKVKDSEPKPIILGRHLIERGLQPGPEFGPISNNASKHNSTASSNRTGRLHIPPDFLRIGNKPPACETQLTDYAGFFAGKLRSAHSEEANSEYFRGSSYRFSWPHAPQPFLFPKHPS